MSTLDQDLITLSLVCFDIPSPERVIISPGDHTHSGTRGGGGGKHASSPPTCPSRAHILLLAINHDDDKRIKYMIG